jgi:hypothetical protein
MNLSTKQVLDIANSLRNGSDYESRPAFEVSDNFGRLMTKVCVDCSHSDACKIYPDRLDSFTSGVLVSDVNLEELKNNAEAGVYCDGFDPWEDFMKTGDVWEDIGYSRK